MTKEIKDSVAIIFSGLYIGGAEKMGINLANKFAKNGNPTRIFIFETVESHLPETIDKRIEIVHIHRKGKLDLLLAGKFNDALRSREINKVIFFCLNPLILTRLLSFERLKNISYYITLHSSIPLNLKGYIKTRILLNFIRKTDKVIFICRNQQEYTKMKYSFSPKNYEIIYNGVDTDHFKPGATPGIENKRKKMHISLNAKIILLVGTLRPEKGHAYAIEALRILHEKFPGNKDTHLVCIGGGDAEYVSGLKELAKKNSLEDYVHFEGNQADVRPYYETADLFTLTSVSIETFSIAALEAMCYGLPLSLTNIGGASEMIFNNQNGLLSNAGDAQSIASTWEQILNYRFDRAAIREIAESKFSLDLIFKQYLQAIK